MDAVYSIINDGFGPDMSSISMPKTLRARLFNIPPIPRRRHLPDLTTIIRHHKQAHIPHKASAGQNAVNSQITARRQPRRDTEIDRERQGIPDQNAHRDHLARKLGVARDGVTQGSRDGYRPVQSHGHLRDGQREPVQVVGHSETVEDHGEGHEDDTRDENVQGVFWFGDAVVSSRQAQGQHLADFADVEAAGRNVSR